MSGQEQVPAETPPAEPFPEVANPDALITDAGQAYAMAAAGDEHRGVLAYLERNEITLLPSGVVKILQNAERAEAEAARTYTPEAESAGASSAEATSPVEIELNEEALKVDLSQRYPVFMIVRDQDGSGVHPRNPLGLSFQANRQGRTGATDMGKVNPEDLKPFIDNREEAVVTYVQSDSEGEGARDVFVYSTTGFLDDNGYPRITMGIFVPPEETRRVLSGMIDNPHALAVTVKSMQEATSGTNASFDDTPLPFRQGESIGFRMLGDKQFRDHGYVDYTNVTAAQPPANPAEQV